jgi:hypothetical protein
MLQKVFSLFRKKGLPIKAKKRKTTGQSLVEFALAFPVLILLLSGVVEFGFIINYYLSLLDATREAARFYSGSDPFLPNSTTDDPSFYSNTAAMVRANLDPFVVNPSYKGRRIVLDPAVDDVIVSVYSFDKTTNTVLKINEVHIYGTHNRETVFTTDSIKDSFPANTPNAGVLTVEVHYNYHQVLALPWFTLFVPDPLPLRAYTVFPLNAAEPVQ